MDKKTQKRAHLVGIKGVAMTSLALYLQDSGVFVTGSDVADEFPTDSTLAKRKIPVYTNFDGKRLIEEIRPDVVYYTGAHGGIDNEEVKTALEHNIEALPHGKALGNLALQSRQIVVCGSHGKTTTSAMIAYILTNAGKDPSYAIGCGGIVGMDAPGRKGSGEWIVLEGDEYVTDPNHDKTPRFHWLKPEILVVTNIDYDHPDVYASLEDVTNAFVQLQKQVQGIGVSIVNADDKQSEPLKKQKNIISYGFSPTAKLRIVQMSTRNQKTYFTLELEGVTIGEFVLSVPGRHNVLNAAAAILASYNAGVDWDSIKKTLVNFGGTKRRFEIIGEVNGSVFVDDYAHHPAEIIATISAAKSWYPDRRIIAVFQPHTYTRTHAFHSAFANAFGESTIVILTDIYASARETIAEGDAVGQLVSETSRYHPRVLYGKNKEVVLQMLKNTINPSDVVIFLGAGDIYTWGKEIVTKLKTQ